MKEGTEARKELEAPRGQDRRWKEAVPSWWPGGLVTQEPRKMNGSGGGNMAPPSKHENGGEAAMKGEEIWMRVAVV